MKQYFATFISGAQDVIAERLRRYPAGQLRLQEVQDGLVVFASSLSANQLSEIRFLNNVYELLEQGSAPQLPPKATYTIRVREGAQPVEVPMALREQVAKQTGAAYTAHNPAYEFLLWRRTDGREFWGLALPRVGFKTRNLEAGELRPELAHILGLVAGLDAKDTVLDPFAGYGAIVRECLQGFHCQEVIAVERNEHLIPHLKAIPHLVALHGDAGQLAHLHTRGIDRVITDPPWGNFAQATEAELRHQYRGGLTQMHRVLRAKGAAVILTAAPFLAELAAECGFAVIKQYAILVSGRKATIYKLRKIG